MSIKSVTLSLNGKTHAIPLDNPSKKYKKVISAPPKSSFSQNGYPMVLQVEDREGNLITVTKDHVTYGPEMLLRVFERNPPAITISCPSTGAYIASHTVTVEFTVIDDDSGVDESTISLQIDSLATATSGITKTAVPGGYRCLYSVQLTDGSHTLKVNACDNDGNLAAQKQSVFTVDTTAPELNISEPPEQVYTKEGAGTVTGNTNDVTSSPVMVNIILNSVDQGEVLVDAEGSFAKTLSWKKGVNTIVVKATDKAGNSSVVSRTVIYDTDAPEIKRVTIAPNPAEAGSEYSITVDAVD